MPDESLPNKTAGEVAVPSGQTPGSGSQPGPATEVGGGGAEAAPWKVKIGDTDYSEADLKTRMVEDYRKLHGSFTQSRQEVSRYRQDSESFQELVGVIRGDPALLAEVRRRVAQGQSPEQAVRKTAENAISDDPGFRSLSQDVETMKQERATEAFYAKHADLADEENDAIIQWIEKNTDKLRNAGWDYEEILDQAHAVVFRERMAPKLIEQGQKMKEEEIQKGQKSKSLGSPSPTAGSQTKKLAGPSYKLKSSERLERAMDIYKKHAK